MWIKHKGALFNLANGTIVEPASGGAQEYKTHFVRITVQGETRKKYTIMDCDSAEEMEALFKGICHKLMPEDYH